MSVVIARLLPLFLLGQILCGAAQAQQQQPNQGPILAPGGAVVTGFSGTVSPDPKKRLPANKSAVDLTFIDPNGASARIFDIGKPGHVWDGSVFAAPQTLEVLAKDVGQVFGIALDDAPQPNAYLAATSLFGLNIIDRGRDGQPERRKKGGPGTGWMRGQFGLDLQGGPGAIYKIDGRTGVPTLFANVTLDGVPNPAPGLGNLAYDPAHKQLFVSDLYTGMIHRFDLDGKELDRYDHGVTALTAAKLPAVPFDPKYRPNIGNARFDSEKPETWGFAPAARRVFGLAVHDGRLYYSVTSGPQIWSVGLTREGAFANDPRWELDVPAQAGPLPVTDIAFSNKGAMILAQRALIAGAYDYSAFTRPGEPQVFRVWLKGPNDPPSPGRWKLVPEEYAVGFAGNYRNTNGGVALGYGYDRNGMASGNACEFSLWTTGQNLRNAPALKDRLDPGGPLVVHGIQGLPASPVRDVNTPPWLSYTIPYGDDAVNPRAIGHMGSLRIYAKPCPAATAYSGPGYPASPPYIVTTSVVGPPPNCLPGVNCPPPPPPRTDIGIAKIGEANSSNPNGPYNFTIGVHNMAGPIATPTTLTFTDVVPAGMTFTNITSSNWTCLPLPGPPIPAGNTVTCNYSGTFPIAANQALGWVTIVATGGNGPYTNCATLGQHDGNASDDKACTTVQTDYGNLVVSKEIVNHTDPQVSTTGLTFPVAVTCGGNVTNLNLVDGLPQTVDHIPFNTTCSAVEGTPPLPANTCAAGQHPAWEPVAYDPAIPVQIMGGTTATIKVKNTLDCVPNTVGSDGYVLVKKEVVSHMMGYPAPPLTFPVNVTCNGSTTTLNLSSDGTAQSVGNLPIGTACTVSEPAVSGNACPTGMTTVWAAPMYSPSNTASAATPGPTVTVTNPFNCQQGGGGSLVVTKIIDNKVIGAPLPSGLTFPVTVTCGGQQTSLTLSENIPQTIANLPIPSSCQIQEGTPPAVNLPCAMMGDTPTWTTAYLPAQNISVNGANTPVTVKNTLECKPPVSDGYKLTVNKQVINNIPNLTSTAGMTFAISASCASGMSPAVVTPMPLPDGGAQTVTGLANGTACTISEVPPPTPTLGPAGCITPGYSPVWTMAIPPAVTINGADASATVQNILDCKPSGDGGLGTLVVTKVVNNNVPLFFSTTGLTYPTAVTCTSGGSPAMVSNIGLTESGPQTIGNIPLSSSCQIVETPPTLTGRCPIPGDVPTWSMPPIISPASPVAVNGDTVNATVTNTLDCKPPVGGGNGYLLVSKIIDNQTADKSASYTSALNALTFPVTATCDGTDTALTVGVGNQAIVHAVPVGQHCNAVEGDAPPPPPSATACSAPKVPTWGPPVYTSVPSGLPVTMTGGAGPVITVTNPLICAEPRDTGAVSLTVTKHVTNNTTGAIGNTSYAVNVSCQLGSDAPVVTPLNLVPEVSQTVTGMAPGANCTVTETEVLQLPPGNVCAGTGPGRPYPAWSTTVTPTTAPVNAPNVPVTVQNTLDCVPVVGNHDRGYVIARKVVNNDTSADLSAMTYPVAMTCGTTAVTLNLTASNLSQTMFNIPVGTHCSAVETLPPPPTSGCSDGNVPTWVNSPSYSGTDVTIVDGQGPIITVTNTLTCLPLAMIQSPLKCTPPQIPNQSRTACVTPPPPPPPPPACAPPMVPGAVPGQCFCPQGLVLRGKECVKAIVCKPPLVANEAGTDCGCRNGGTLRRGKCVEVAKPKKREQACPRGTVRKNGECVERERKRPAITTDDVIRVLPGLIGGHGGGAGRRGSGDSGGGAGGGGGGGGGYKPPGVK